MITLAVIGMLLSAGWETQAAFGDGRQLLRKTGERERVIEREREREKNATVWKWFSASYTLFSHSVKMDR